MVVFITRAASGVVGALRRYAPLHYTGATPMESKESTTPVSSTQPTEQGSPKKGFKYLISWATWIIQSIIAVFIASVVWGKLEGPSILDTSLSVLGVVGLFAAVKSFAPNKKVNYLILYPTFFIGLQLYRWLWDTIVTYDSWHSYWWLPFLLMAPVTLKLPIIDIELSTLAPRLALRLGMAVWSAVVPFRVIYKLIDAFCQPKRTFAFARKNILVTVSVIVVLLACSFVGTLLVPRFVPTSILAIAVAVYLIFGAGYYTVMGIISSEKMDIAKTGWTKTVYSCGGHIALPFIAAAVLEINGDSKTTSSQAESIPLSASGAEAKSTSEIPNGA